MATTRAELKMIIKECLLELLNEGLGNHAPASGSRSTINGTVRERAGRRQPSFDPRLDARVPIQDRPVEGLRETIKRAAGGNPMMADILADTAVTTLPSQLSSGDTMGMPSVGHGGGASLAQQEQFVGNPDEVFGDAAASRSDGTSHWSDLAFMGTSKKST